jgi:hypothetical protein
MASAAAVLAADIERVVRHPWHAELLTQKSLGFAEI